MKIPLEDKINDPFAKKQSRADLQYIPQVKDLSETMYVGDLSTKDGRDNLNSVLKNYIIMG